ncbi:MAG: FtsX-like permease family protein [Muribaculaceae bacterium]|nr:FtsX-like permease family protein [Muribaculaceae bacterium]
MKSYFVFLSRHKLYTAIQALGLIISIAFIILIGNYVWQQYSLAYSNKDYDRIFVVGSDLGPSLSGEDKDELVLHLPDIDVASRYCLFGIYVKPGDEFFEATCAWVDKDFFEIFPEFEIIAGNIKDFVPGETYIISEKLANQFYADRNPIGETMEGHNGKIAGIYKVTGQTIVQEPDIIYIAPKDVTNGAEPFSELGLFLTFIKIHKDFNTNELLLQITNILEPHYKNESIKQFKLFPLPDMYFNNHYELKGTDKAMLHVMLAVVILLLLSSMINYTNLSLALSGDRTKEMATRMLIGSSVKDIIIKNISESLVFVSLCGGLGIALAYIFLQPVDHILQQIAINDPDDLWRYSPLVIRWNVASVFIFLGFIFLLGIISGILPALYSSFTKPIDIIRGNTFIRNKKALGKCFIVFQNILSVMLISLSLVMESQMNHMYHRPLHARNENVIIDQVLLPGYAFYKPLLERFRQIPGVVNAGVGDSYPGSISMRVGVKVPDQEEEITVGALSGDKNYFEIMGLELIEETKETTESPTIYLSKSFANAFEFNQDKIKQNLNKISMRQMTASEYGGIYQDIPLREANSNDSNTKSAFILTKPEELLNINTIIIQVEKESKEIKEKIIQTQREYIKEIYGFTFEPFSFGFVQELNEESLSSIKSTIVLLEIFMGLSVMISLLGLIAMSTYYANENTKGIAIRKVLGSDVKGEIWRNIRLYMILVLIAISVAIPVAIVISREYLSRFAYRIENYWWIFIVASVGSLLIAFLSVYWQISRSAHINPATELKKE